MLNMMHISDLSFRNIDQLSGGQRQRVALARAIAVRQRVLLRKGLTQEIAKKLSKSVRDNLKKVTVAIQGESLRITGKNKDDLQTAISILREIENDLEVPLQFENYR